VSNPDAAASGTFALGGDLVANRLGFGSMQLTGPGVWGEPTDPDEAVRVLRRSVELGVNLIDTADSYGPFVAERLIKKALFPYPDGVIIATKAGLTRPGPGAWTSNGDPIYLRGQAEKSLINLGLERLDLLQLHRIDPRFALADQIGVLKDLQDEGKVRHIGVSEVTVAELQAAEKIASISSVQNLYNLSDRSSDDLVDYAETRHIAFIPWFPLATGALAQQRNAYSAITGRLEITPSQLAIAWLLKRSPAMLPIPGTSSVAHLEDNIRGASVELTDRDYAEITAVR
jgi:pyridoxine 4-dehydrogenase